ncbi:hypothetical protein TKK_0018054 [Trichogramma kaykai]
MRLAKVADVAALNKPRIISVISVNEPTEGYTGAKHVIKNGKGKILYRIMTPPNPKCACQVQQKLLGVIQRLKTSTEKVFECACGPNEEQIESMINFKYDSNKVTKKKHKTTTNSKAFVQKKKRQFDNKLYPYYLHKLPLNCASDSPLIHTVGCESKAVMRSLPPPKH